MKTTLLIMILAVLMASCKTAKQGCPGASYQGEKHKAQKFSWYGG